MRGVREFGNALVVAILSIGLTLGALSASLVGFIPEEIPSPTAVLILSPIPVTATNTVPPSLTPPVSFPSLTPISTNTIAPPVSCQPPAGWVATVIQAGDTLESLAIRHAANRDILKTSNCLISENLIPGTLLYVPGVPTSTAAVCNRGASGWSPNYRVVSGDTLYSIALRYYTTLNTLKRVNCLVSDRINSGDLLWVPNVATRTPSFTPQPGMLFTVTPYLTEPLTETVLPFTLTPVPTQTPVPATPTPVPTQTSSPTAFPTPTQ